MTCSTRSLSVRRHDPVADRHVGADVADPQGFGRAAGLGHRADHGAPAAIEAGDPARDARRSEGHPRRVEIVGPSELRRRVLAPHRVHSDGPSGGPSLIAGIGRRRGRSTARNADRGEVPAHCLDKRRPCPLAKGTDAQAPRRGGVASESQDAVEVPRQRLRRARLGRPRRRPAVEGSEHRRRQRLQAHLRADRARQDGDQGAAGGAQGRLRALSRDRRGPRGRGHFSGTCSSTSSPRCP